MKQNSSKIQGMNYIGTLVSSNLHTMLVTQHPGIIFRNKYLHAPLFFQLK